MGGAKHTLTEVEIHPDEVWRNFECALLMIVITKIKF